MNNKFDELAKGVAQTVTRREALKKFGVGVIGVALGCFGLANIARAARGACCRTDADCSNPDEFCDFSIPCGGTTKNNKTHKRGTCHCIQCGV